LAYVAMTDSGCDRFTARPDGAGVRQLTTTGKVAAPEWSPDHRTLAFTVRSRRGGYVLWTVRADGHGLRRVTGVGYRPPELAWAPGGRAVAYGDGPHLCVYTLASRARKCRRISDNDVETVSHPSFAPGGDVLVFSLTDNTEVSHLMVVGARKGPVRRLTRLRGSELDPSWSPRGDSIAFTLALGDQFDRRGRTTVMTVRADGSHPRVLLATAGLDDGPAWSPDGRRVVVRSDGPRAAGGTAQPGVWVVDADGRHPRLAVPGRGIAYVDW
jgi:TolB protein